MKLKGKKQVPNRDEVEDDEDEDDDKQEQDELQEDDEIGGGEDYRFQSSDDSDEGEQDEEGEDEFVDQQQQKGKDAEEEDAEEGGEAPIYRPLKVLPSGEQIKTDNILSSQPFNSFNSIHPGRRVESILFIIRTL